MSRGAEASPLVYEGPLGYTTRSRVHYVCPSGAAYSVEVVVVVNVGTDPDLARRLISEDPETALNTVKCQGEATLRAIDIPVLYHDSDNEIFALVLWDSLRHRELEERIALLARLAEASDLPAPGYVRDFAVVWGAAGLKHYLEDRAEREVRTTRAAERERELTVQVRELKERERGLLAQRTELEHVTEELDRRTQELSATQAELGQRASALDRRSAELARQSTELSAKEADKRMADAAAAVDHAELEEPTPISQSPLAELEAEPEVEEPTPLPRPVPHEAITTEPFELMTAARRPPRTLEGDDAVMEIEPEPLDDDEIVVADQLVSTSGSDAPVTDDGKTRVGGAIDVAIERWIVSRESVLKALDDAGVVRLAASVEGSARDLLLSDPLDLRLQLHRLPSYPLVTLSFGTPESLGDPACNARPYSFMFELSDSSDRAVLDALATEFTFDLDVYDTSYHPVRRRTITARLADNARYVLSAAEQHLANIDEVDRSFARALVQWDNPAYDRRGFQHPEYKEFRDDKLQRTDSPNALRYAIAIANRFTKPEREEYLMLVRGYPARLWQRRRGAVLVRALEVGLWPGERLATLAVHDGLVRSRRELVRLLHQNFTGHAADPNTDLSADVIADNWSDLEREVQESGAIESAHEPVVSGTIPGLDSVQSGIDNLLGRLDDKDRRLDASIELCLRGDEKAVGPVFNALRRMTRHEAVQVLGASVGFGVTAVPHLVDGLRSRKGFLRQGCALALGVIGSDEGIEAICDLLVAEPTEIWRELARAIGEIGEPALMPLLSRMSVTSADADQRISWALAHVAAKGGTKPIELIAGGRDRRVASIARRALTQVDEAASENMEVRGTRAPRDQTVKRAFSRRFFEALERGGADEAVGHLAEDLSQPAMLLDESDLLETADGDEEAEMLDESDLLPT